VEADLKSTIDRLKNRKVVQPPHNQATGPGQRMTPGRPYQDGVEAALQLA